MLPAKCHAPEESTPRPYLKTHGDLARRAFQKVNLIAAEPRRACHARDIRRRGAAPILHSGVAVTGNLRVGPVRSPAALMGLAHPGIGDACSLYCSVQIPSHPRRVGDVS